MFTLTIKTEDDAFAGPDGFAELARILKRAAADVGDGATSGSLFDIDGNRVGSYRWER